MPVAIMVVVVVGWGADIKKTTYFFNVHHLVFCRLAFYLQTVG